MSSCRICGDQGKYQVNEREDCYFCNGAGSVYANQYSALPSDQVGHSPGYATCPKCKGARYETVTSYRWCNHCDAAQGLVGRTEVEPRGSGPPDIVLTPAQIELLCKVLAFPIIIAVLVGAWFYLLKPLLDFGLLLVPNETLRKPIALYLEAALIVLLLFRFDFGPFKCKNRIGPRRQVFRSTFYGAAGLLITVLAAGWLPDSREQVYWLTIAASVGFAVAAIAAIRAWFLIEYATGWRIFWLCLAMLGALGVASHLYLFASPACIDVANVRGSVAVTNLSPPLGAWNACIGTETAGFLNRLVYEGQIMSSRPTAVILAFCALGSALIGSLLNLLRNPDTVKPTEPARWMQSGGLRCCLFLATAALPLLVVCLVTGALKTPPAWADGPKMLVSELVKPTARLFDPIQPTYRYARPDTSTARVKERVFKRPKASKPGDKARGNAKP